MNPGAAWPRRGRAWLVVGQVACLITMVLAGRASAARGAAAGQGAWVAIAVIAALISAAGNGIWLAVVRRAATARRQVVVARLEARADGPAVAAVAPAEDPGRGRSVMVPGLTLRHRPGCALVAGKAVVPAAADAAPCGWCEP